MPVPGLFSKGLSAKRLGVEVHRSSGSCYCSSSSSRLLFIASDLLQRRPVQRSTLLICMRRATSPSMQQTGSGRHFLLTRGRLRPGPCQFPCPGQPPKCREIGRLSSPRLSGSPRRCPPYLSLRRRLLSRSCLPALGHQRVAEAIRASAQVVLGNAQRVTWATRKKDKT